MIGRIVEVADDRRHLSLHRGFMVVQDTEGERKQLGQVPLDDIAAVIANAHGLSYTNNLLVALSERGAPFVLCAANHNAVGMLLPIDGNFEQAKRIEAQIAASLPTHKRLWAAVVRSKLEQQAAALEAVGLTKWASHTPSELSGGQQQRVAIARAIVTRPTVLLADEPTGNLDTKNSREIMELLAQLNREQGITVLMVTHEPDMAAYAHRVIRFVDGQVESDTRTDAAQATPAGAA
ncbi:ABC transporter ATP-binding protein YtrE [mine drainage metagenome]|uniref:ABC transporter ATP-binding protein YtrE n=1 Tax=mine drainage metagenome TaxID=410659 RepID=A0A1J5Q959_9ZZZZ